MQRTGIYRLGVLGLCCVVVLGVGCRRAGRLDEHERNSRLVAKAYEQSNLGNYDAAIGLFSKALDTNPRLVRPHLDLALLLQDRKQDYVRAIYHYKRYLERRPTTEKAAMIKGRIRQAEREFVALHTERAESIGIPVQELEARNVKLKTANDALRRQVKALEAQVADLKEEARKQYLADVVGDATAEEAPELSPVPDADAGEQSAARTRTETAPPPRDVEAPPVEEAERTLPSSDAPPAATPPESAQSTSAPSRQATTVPARRREPQRTDAGLRTYTVRRGDSLSKIAYRVYGDATQWRKIQRANRETLGNSVTVKAEQVLVIP